MGGVGGTGLAEPFCGKKSEKKEVEVASEPPEPPAVFNFKRSVACWFGNYGIKSPRFVW